MLPGITICHPVLVLRVVAGNDHRDGILTGQCAREAISFTLGASGGAPLPDEYRRTGLDSPKDHFVLSRALVLFDGKWAAAKLKHVSQRRSVGVGWLAIELGTGKAVYLQPPPSRQPPKDVLLGRAGFHDRISGWRTGSLAVGVRMPSEERVRNATPESVLGTSDPDTIMAALYPRDERCLLWEWRPQQGAIERLDWFAPVGGLVQVLEGTPYQVASWEPPFFGMSGWSGRIRLRNRDHGEFSLLEFPDPERPLDARPFDALYGYDSWQDFGPTQDRHAIVVLDRLGIYGDCPLIRMIDLANKSRRTWQIGREIIENAADGLVREIRLVRGPKRPCRYLPLIAVQPDAKAAEKRPLWILDSSTGRLDGPHSLPWGFEGSFFHHSFEGRSLRASNDGRLLTYYTEYANDWKRRPVVVYDTREKKIVASRNATKCYVEPIGFDATGNVILTSEREVFRWTAPFKKEWEAIFSLDGRK
jgi:hypothetical protein